MSATERRRFTPGEMNQIGDALAYSNRALAHAVSESSEMVPGGYVADLTSEQIADLRRVRLPTGRSAR